MDLIERLRTFGAYAMDEDGNMSEFHPNALTTAAADEIERLRAEVRRVPLGHITTLCELEVASEEIERLRARVEFVELAKAQATSVYDAAYSERLAEIERLRDALANARTGAALLALERKQELVDQLADALWAQAGVKDGTLHPLTDIALAAYDDSRHN